MFCGNCGSKNEDGDKFCQQCGAALQATNAPSQSNETEVLSGQIYSQSDPTPTVPQTQPKKRGVNLIAIAAVILVVIIAAGVALNSAGLSNFVRKATSSDEEYLAYVGKKSTDEFASEISSAVEKLSTDDASAGKGGISVELGKAGLEFIESMSGMELDWVKKATVEFEAHVKDNNIAISAGLVFNDVLITTAEAIMDSENQMLYFRLPDFDSQYVSVSLSDVTPAAGNSLLAVGLSSVSEILPSADETETLIKRYFDVIYGCLDDVKKEADSVTVKDVSEKCDKYTVEIDNELLVRVVKEVITEAKDDKDIEKLFKKISGVAAPKEDANELYSNFAAQMESALENIDGAVITDTKSDLCVWIDSKGEIIGLELSVPEATVSYLAPENGKKFALELKVTAEGTAISLEGEGTISGSKKSGAFSVNVMGMELATITVTDLDTEKLEDGCPNGTVEIAPSSGLISMISGVSADELSSELDATSEATGMLGLISKLKLKIDMNSSEDKTDYKITVLVDSAEWAILNIYGEEIKATDISVPSASINANDDEAMEEWASKLGTDALSKIISKLEEAGVPSELLGSFNGFGGASVAPAETMAPW